MRESPGPEVALIAFAPAYDAPRTAQMEAISSSHWMVMPPTWGSFAESHSRMSDAGVMGYPAKKSRPAAIAPTAIAWLPDRRMRSSSTSTALVISSDPWRSPLSSPPARRAAMLASATPCLWA